MSTAEANTIIKKLGIQSKKCHSIKDYLDLAFSFKSDSLAINPFQIKTEIYTLLEILAKEKPKTVLEIGTANGGTLFLLLKICPKDATFLGIDLPEGKFGGEFFPDWKIPLYESFSSNQQKIHIIRADSHDKSTLEQTKKILKNKKIDFLFIDGDHTYEGVKKDFEIYKKIIADDGIIAFHDICPGSKELAGEVSKFWNELKSKYTTLEIIDNDNKSGYGIGLIFPNPVFPNKKYRRILETMVSIQNSLNIEKNKKELELVSPLKKELDEEIKKRTQLQKEFDERSKWALELNDLVKEKDTTIINLQKEFDERTKWALTLDEKAKKAEFGLKKTQKELSDAENRFKEAKDQFDKAQNDLITTEAELQKADDEFKQAQNDLLTTEAELQQAEDKFKQAEKDLLTIEAELQHLFEALR